ncbi:hypothetical protein BKP45_13435 [Anaerobacillus alkalidiazotrophicus]|uniref:DUF5668 domain-containing protein n=1 Tax=Anaerobacillus alkalidiazotrophicus TaxID=472963 RepID=A0A1S2M418_9BACI|nr:hypothetical protein [Anaerobacillus alkalidiazotrophicus]OIJ19441.1 hypothetical protein BKP45_13435 [Anaerobacillus alkalidiazotrophicus]
MRTWRVGTFSMGFALVFLGVFLLFSKVIGMDVHQVMISWWPVILIILGIEILLFLFLNKKESAIIKYDFFSILIIGMLGTVGIAFFIFSSVGLVDEVTAAITSQVETRSLPELSEVVPTEVRRIVVDSSWEELTIEGAETNGISVFGTYRQNVSPQKVNVSDKAEKYVSLNQIDDTLYVTMKRLPHKNGLHSNYATVNGTLVIPSNLDLELRSTGNNVVLRPRIQEADWIIERANNVIVHVQENGDVAVEASQISHIYHDHVEWKSSESELQEGSFTIGEGKNKIKILNAYQLNVFTF